MPKRQRWPCRLCFISGSCSSLLFSVELGTAIKLAPAAVAPNANHCRRKRMLNIFSAEDGRRTRLSFGSHGDAEATGSAHGITFSTPSWI